MLALTHEVEVFGLFLHSRLWGFSGTVSDNVVNWT